jgi:hypothetical protein
MYRNSVTFVGVLIVALFVLASCKQEEPPPPPTPSNAPLAAAPKSTPPPTFDPGELPPGHPPIGGQTPGEPAVPQDDIHSGMQLVPKPGADRRMLDTAPTQFEGLTLMPPEGWQAFDPGASPMGPIAAFLLPPAEGAEGDTEARLTHFPAMKNIPVEANLDRWYGQVQQPDGKPTKEVATLGSFDAGGAKITVADMSGTINGIAGQRMIAAAIEHPNGPHFLRVAGPEATVAKWRDSVEEYLKSAKVEP